MMDEKCGELFEEATREKNNKTLIDFEFSFNNFRLDDVTNTHPIINIVYR
jgi:hypothetical protein